MRNALCFFLVMSCTPEPFEWWGGLSSWSAVDGVYVDHCSLDGLGQAVDDTTLDVERDAEVLLVTLNGETFECNIGGLTGRAECHTAATTEGIWEFGTGTAEVRWLSYLLIDLTDPEVGNARLRTWEVCDGDGCFELESSRTPGCTTEIDWTLVPG